MINRASAFFVMIVLLAACVGGSPAQALIGPGLPTNVCSGLHYQCDEKAEHIWSLFEDAQAIPPKNGNILTVGGCSFNGVTDGTVNVLLGLSTKLPRKYFDASIGFYSDFTEYRKLPASALPYIFPEIHQERNLIVRAEDYDYIEYMENAFTRYWIRYSPATNSLVMVSYFGFKYTILCEFPLNGGQVL